MADLAAGPRDSGLTGWRIGGKAVRADLYDAVRDATLRRSVDGADTFTVTVSDPHRALLRSGVFEQRLTCTYGGLLFEYTQCRVGEGTLDLKFEDAHVADMRRAKGRTPGSTARAGTVSRAAFVSRLALAASPGLRVVAAPAPRSLEALSRGSQDEPDEDSWTAGRRILEAIGWRMLARSDGLFLAPDDWLLRRVPPVVLQETTPPVRGWITGDFDARKRTTEASLVVDAGRWTLPPGDPVRLDRQGPLSGLWLVKEIERGAFTTEATVTLTRRQPALPEPKPEPRDDGSPDAGPAAAGGGRSTVGPVSARGLSWPLAGPISSGYGRRGGKLHAGIDLAVPVGTTVRAAADGTVTFTGASSGYGTAVYLEHAGGLFTRYGHLSRASVRRGQDVRRGDQIGLSGNTGSSTGPHLHFEVRPGNKAVDPRGYLPSTR